MADTTPTSRVLTGAQVRKLLVEVSATPDPEISRRALADAYQLADGQELLVLDNGKGRLYESRAALLDMMDAIEAQPQGPPLAGRLPQGADFPAQAARLAAELGVPALSDLDGVVHRLGATACLEHPTFGRLVAYVGETIQHARGGAWQMRRASDGTSWEPWLVDAAGHQHAPFNLVLKELIDWGPESSLTGVVSGHLGSFRG